MSLPESIRDKIYEMVGIANLPLNGAAYWLTLGG